MSEVAAAQVSAGGGASSPPSTGSLKAALRREMVARARAIPPAERDRLASAAASTLARFLRTCVPPGEVVGLYAATATELPSAPAIHALADHYPLAFPRVAGDTIRFHRAPFESLTAHTSRILEPLATYPEVQPAALVIPGRAFDRFGVRLGHGAGYYDRTLAALPPGTLLVGVCFSFQVVDELPREPYDRWVHWLVTEEGDPRRCQALPTRMQVLSGGPSSSESLGASVPPEWDVP